MIGESVEAIVLLPGKERNLSVDIPVELQQVSQYGTVGKV